MKKTSIVLLLLLALTLCALTGCGYDSDYSQVPTQRIIIEKQDSWSDFLRAQTDAQDSMHRRNMETMQSIGDSLDDFMGTAGRGVSHMGHHTKSYLRRRK
jgi:hypothetical protein